MKKFNIFASAVVALSMVACAAPAEEGDSMEVEAPMEEVMEEETMEETMEEAADTTMMEAEEAMDEGMEAMDEGMEEAHDHDGHDH